MLGGFSVGVLDIEVVVAGLDLIQADLPGKRCLLAAGAAGRCILAPPVLLGLEFLNGDGLGFVVTLRARRVRVLVIPDGLGGLALGEEK